MEAQALDKLVAKLDPVSVAVLIQSAQRLQQAPPRAATAVRDQFLNVYEAVSVSSGRPALLQLSELDDLKSRQQLATGLSKIISAAPAVQQGGTISSLRRQIEELKEQLKLARDETATVRETLKREIDGLTVALEFAEHAGHDDDEDDDDGDDHTLPPPTTTLYITRLAWKQAIDYVIQWRKLPGNAGTDATAFVDWLYAQAVTDEGAKSSMKLLQRATDFSADFIDPQPGIDARTPDETVALLREATVQARQGDYEQFPVSDTLREPLMDHIVYSQELWPAVVAAMHAFNADHWGGTPEQFLWWLQSSGDDRRRQLLALMSAGAPINQADLIGKLPDSSQSFFERAVQAAEDRLRANQFDFVPVPLPQLMAQLTDALSIIDKELPALSKQLSSTELQSSAVYNRALQRLRTIRKQLAVDWFMRLGTAEMTRLIDQAMKNDTDDNRKAVVDSFEKMLATLTAEMIGSTRPVKWVLM